jgi:plastocyanin
MNIAILVFIALIGLCPSVPDRDTPSFRPPAGVIRGHISMNSDTRQDESLKTFLLLNHYAISKALQLEEHASAHAEHTPLAERAVVYLESAQLARGNYAPPSRHPLLDQRNLRFRPRVLPILVGTTVDFPNHDALFHNVFSYSQPKEFDLGRYPKGDSKSVTFDKPGIVNVYCDIHAHMKAVILVLEHPYFASPDEQGNYAIANVPDGAYTLKFWLDDQLADERRVTVNNGATVTEDFQR